MLLIFSFLAVGVGAFWIGYRTGGDAVQQHWIEQIKRDERARHLTQGNAFWQK